MKKTAIIALLLGTNPSFCGTMGPEGAIENYNGIYIGADVGLSDLNDSQSTVVPSQSHHLGGFGAVGGGLLGFDYGFTELFKLGFEGFINANGMQAAVRHYTNNASYKIQSNYNWGFRFLPGIEFTPGSVGHVILGYSNAQFNIKDNGCYGYVNQTFNGNGFQAGLGLSTFIVNSISLRVDGLYTTYIRQTTPGITTIGGYNVYKNGFSTLEGDVTLSYKFSI